MCALTGLDKVQTNYTSVYGLRESCLGMSKRGSREHLKLEKSGKSVTASLRRGEFPARAMDGPMGPLR